MVSDRSQEKKMEMSSLRVVQGSREVLDNRDDVEDVDDEDDVDDDRDEVSMENLIHLFLWSTMPMENYSRLNHRLFHNVLDFCHLFYLSFA